MTDRVLNVISQVQLFCGKNKRVGASLNVEFFKVGGNFKVVAL